MKAVLLVPGWICRRACLEEKMCSASLMYPARLCSASFEDEAVDFPKTQACSQASHSFLPGR